jgi:hypothetical protein
MKGSYTAAKLTIVTVGSMPPIAAFEVSPAVALLSRCRCPPVLQRTLARLWSMQLPALVGRPAGRGAHTAGRDCHGV